MNEVRLQELRAEHQAMDGTLKGFCRGCYPGLLKEWPCETSELLDLALEAERLRAAYEKTALDWHDDYCADVGLALCNRPHCKAACNALAGTEVTP